jgi:hypothetical protein
LHIVYFLIMTLPAGCFRDRDQTTLQYSHSGGFVATARRLKRLREFPQATIRPLNQINIPGDEPD